MRRILIGPIMDGNAGGIDRYILNLYHRTSSEDIQFDFFTNKISKPLQSEFALKNARLFEVPSLTNPFGQYKDFQAIFKQNKYDTAYFNFSTALGFLGPMAAEKSGVPKIVIHAHATGCDIANPYKRKLQVFLHKICKSFLYRFGTDFYACSSLAGEWMFPNRIVKSEHFQIVKNAIDIEQFAFNPVLRKQMRQELRLTDSFVIGHVGNFVYAKNHMFLLNAFQRLHQKIPNAKLLLVGDGPLYQAVQSSAAQMHLENDIVFVGRQKSNAYLQAMDVFAFPSNFEGLGIVAIEAQAAGLPCVCSDRVPKETGATDLCTFLPIDTEDALRLWVDRLTALQGLSRKDVSDALTSDGYNIRQQKLNHLV